MSTTIPRFETLAPFSVVGVQGKFDDPPAQIPGLWREHGPRIDALIREHGGRYAYGVNVAYDEASGVCDYMAGAEAPVQAAADDLRTFDCPGGEYAVFTTSLAELSTLYGELWGNWAAHCNRPMREGVWLERYGSEFDETGQMEILVPVG